jgi:hypothetical protein
MNAWCKLDSQRRPEVSVSLKSWRKPENWREPEKLAQAWNWAQDVSKTKALFSLDLVEALRCRSPLFFIARLSPPICR